MKDLFAEWWGHSKKKEDTIEFKPFVEEPEQAPAPKPAPAPERVEDFGKPNTDAGMELKVVRPESYTEVAVIANYLLDGCTVFLNMDLLDDATTRRMVEFLLGVTYAIDGKIKKSSASTFIITPHNVDITDEKEN